MRVFELKINGKYAGMIIGDDLITKGNQQMVMRDEQPVFVMTTKKGALPELTFEITEDSNEQPK